MKYFTVHISNHLGDFWALLHITSTHAQFTYECLSLWHVWKDLSWVTILLLIFLSSGAEGRAGFLHIAYCLITLYAWVRNQHSDIFKPHCPEVRGGKSVILGGRETNYFQTGSSCFLAMISWNICWRYFVC